MSESKPKTSPLTWLLAGVLSVVLAVAVFQSSSGDPVNTPTQSDHALNMARQFVRQHLKDKTGAEFDRSAETYTLRKDGLHAASGSVRSQNGFGATLDNRWSVILRGNEDGSWGLVWLRVGDQKTGEYPADE